MENTVKTFQELKNALGTDEQGSGTQCGWVVFNNQKIYVRRHWSYSGGFPVYLDEACLFFLGELVNSKNDEDWFPYFIDGIRQQEHGIWDLFDCNLLFEKANENLDLFIDKYWDDLAIIYSQSTDATDKRLVLLLEKENITNPFETLKYLREYAYHYKCNACQKWSNESYEI
jgi:hypothetical protein